MSIKNEVMLITYADSMGKNLKELNEVLTKHFKGTIGGVHLLPFYPSSADRGFAPKTYKEVDKPLGTWRDVQDLSNNFYLMFDFMVNHISQSSEYFQDFKQKKEGSDYADLFIQYKNFWPNGEPTQEDVDKIYKRKPRAPYIDVTFGDGSTEKIWCTFNEEQIDLNVYHERTKKFIQENLEYLSKKGASIMRLDAFAYATKQPGTNCFFIEPDTWEMLDEIKAILDPYGVEILPEIHEHYSIQLKIAERGYWVYDFALPMLVLHALYSGRSDRLTNWLRICPKKQFTTLDTHDGIGVVDVADLLSNEEMEETRDNLFTKGANVKRVYNTMEYNNLDIYQLNCTYYSALGNKDDAYVLARAIQFFTPGIPQVYYVGLLAGENDIELLEETKEGRNINRHYYTKEEIDENMKRPVMDRLTNLMKFRNDFPAFDGEIEVIEQPDSPIMEIIRTNGKHQATLKANLKTHEYEVTYIEPETGAKKVLAGI
ncbi:sucrose phosphorylase [Salipaludibacillus daqingensis]|uniref:sucrose phosphorylase n=1 Tax=Salipaludibacillus daqingensis TaxID=3041001 RepID=UPI002475B042|nr:sucrose phosphorylase [Salipaludibacillus daqingensis]